MWDGDRRTSYDLYVRGGAVVVAAFIVTGLVFFAGQRAWTAAQSRIGNRYARTTGDESFRFAPSPTGQPGYSPGAPGSGGVMPRLATGPSATTFNAPPALPPPVAPPPPPAVSFGGGAPFTGEAERMAARAAVAPLRESFAAIRKYDGAAAWEEIAPANAASSLLTETRQTSDAAGIRDAGDSGDETGPARRVYPARQDAAARRQRAMQRILTETDALGAEITLLAHPDRFPEPLRDLAGEVGREARIYLSTIQYAVIHPEERAELRARAQRHLTRSEESLRQLEATVGGTGPTGASGF